MDHSCIDKRCREAKVDLAFNSFQVIVAIDGDSISR